MIEQKVGLLWQNSKERFEYIHLDEYFPSKLLADKLKYKDFILPNTEHSVYDFYER